MLNENSLTELRAQADRNIIENLEIICEMVALEIPEHKRQYFVDKFFELSYDMCLYSKNICDRAAVYIDEGG